MERSNLGKPQHPLYGTKFELSKEGEEMVGRKRTGIIVGESTDGQAWWIVFDGLRSRSSFHKDFICLLETPTAQTTA